MGIYAHWSYMTPLSYLFSPLRSVLFIEILYKYQFIRLIGVGLDPPGTKFEDIISDSLDCVNSSLVEKILNL